MKVLKVVAEGLTTSFRYPHFIQGMHITFEMPPPSTIYGHICSAVGEDIGRNYTRFAYHFQYETKFEDYEHLHFFGKESKMNPFKREQLFKPKLTLYLDNISLLSAFISPHYPVVLGRSQDLMTYTTAEIIELQPAERAFYSGTLLSLEQAMQLNGNSYAVTMPRFINEQRETVWGQYSILKHTYNPLIYPNAEGLSFEIENPIEIWVDPQNDASHSYLPELRRGIVWHEW
jgi:CRISPR-associated protein Cas5t